MKSQTAWKGMVKIKSTEGNKIYMKLHGYAFPSASPYISMEERSLDNFLHGIPQKIIFVFSDMRKANKLFCINSKYDLVFEGEENHIIPIYCSAAYVIANNKGIPHKLRIVCNFYY